MPVQILDSIVHMHDHVKSRKTFETHTAGLSFASSPSSRTRLRPSVRRMKEQSSTPSLSPLVCAHTHVDDAKDRRLSDGKKDSSHEHEDEITGIRRWVCGYHSLLRQSLLQLPNQAIIHFFSRAKCNGIVKMVRSVHDTRRKVERSC